MHQFRPYSRLSSKTPSIVVWSNTFAMNEPNIDRSKPNPSKRVLSKGQFRSTVNSPPRSRASQRPTFKTSKIEIEFENIASKRICKQKPPSSATVKSGYHTGFRPLTSSGNSVEFPETRDSIPSLLKCESLRSIHTPNCTEARYNRCTHLKEFPRVLYRKYAQLENAKQLKLHRAKKAESNQSQTELKRVNSQDIIEIFRKAKRTFKPPSQAGNIPVSMKKSLEYPLSSVLSAPTSPKGSRHALRLTIPRVPKQHNQSVQASFSSQASPRGWSPTSESSLMLQHRYL